MKNLFDIHYHQKREDDDIFYAYFVFNEKTHIFIHRPGDVNWVWIDKEADPDGWWYCHSNIFRVSHSFKVTIEEIGKAGLPIINPNEALKIVSKINQ